MRGLVRLLREGFIVKASRRVRVETQVELILPAELEPGAGDGIIAQPGRRMTFRQICRMCSELVGDDAGFYVFPVTTLL